jgi:hypothetical protein
MSDFLSVGSSAKNFNIRIEHVSAVEISKDRAVTLRLVGGQIIELSAPESKDFLDKAPSPLKNSPWS